jgi:signal transduction histidine kinase
MMRRWSLRTRFVTAAALCLLPVIGVSLYLLDSSLDHSEDQLVDTDFAVSDVVSQGLAATLDENQVALAELAKDPRVQSMSVTGAPEALAQMRAARPSLSGVFLLSPDGSVAASSGGIDPNALLSQFTEVTTKALNGGEAAISDKLTYAEGNVEVIALVQPVLPDPAAGAEGLPVGAVGSFLNVERLQKAFVPSTGFASGDTTIAIVTASQVITTSTGEASGGSVLTRELLAEAVPDALTGKRATETYRDGDGHRRLAVVAPLDHPGVQWAVVVTTPSPMTYGPNQTLLRNGLTALAAAALLALVLAMVFAEMTARPLRKISRQAKWIAEGAVGTPLEPVGRGEVAQLSEAVRDMADRLTTQVRDTEAAREEVAVQAERLRDLLRRTVRLQEDERRRIAGDIHDAVSPLITGALYQTRAMQLGQSNGHALNGAAEAHAAAEPDEAFQTVNELLERAMAELHDVIFALRPPDLDDLGVVAAIERYVAQINRTGLPSHLAVIGEPQRLSAEARLGVYRIVQEALHNALRHAHADEAKVRMEWLEDRLRVTVHDNGSGFDPEQASNPNSLGLLSMRERASAIGATLEIHSRLGGGTAIVLERSLTYDVGPEGVQEHRSSEPGASQMTLIGTEETSPPITPGEHEVRTA